MNKSHNKTEKFDISLSFVILAYNEAGNIEQNVRHAVHELARILDLFEVLIIDDGSRDGTGRIAEELASCYDEVKVIHHPFNLGYGAAQKTGMAHAKYDWLMYSPADNQFNASDVKEFLKYTDKYDIIASYRLSRQDTLMRSITSWVFNLMMRRLFNLHLKDINWVKLYKKSILREISIESHGFFVDAEILIKAKNAGYKIFEISVPHYARTWGAPTTVRLGVVFKTLVELFKLRKKLLSSQKR